MALIDPTARIEDGARIGQDCIIGPYCTVGREAVIGDGCRLEAHVHVSGRTTIGPRTIVHPFACLGGPPQSLAYRGEPTTLSIGSDCVIRESVTMNRGTVEGGGETVVGDRGYFMCFSHVAHDCRVGDNAIFANCATLAGHCVLGDHVFLSGHVAIHQFTRVGSGAMVAGVSALRGDLIPFGMAVGAHARLIGINVVGMRRRRHPVASVRAVRTAYRTLFFGSGSMAERIAETREKFGGVDEVASVLAFLELDRTRPLCLPRPPESERDRPDDPSP